MLAVGITEVKDSILMRQCWREGQLDRFISLEFVMVGVCITALEERKKIKFSVPVLGGNDI